MSLASHPWPIEVELNDFDKLITAPHQTQGVFFNPWRVHKQDALQPLDPKKMLQWKLLSRNPYAREKRRAPDLEVQPEALPSFEERRDDAKLLWVGHASFLVELDGVRILIDPVFGSASPLVPRAVQPPFALQELRKLDVVLLTHGHYDHLDVAAFKRIGRHCGADTVIATPLGLANYLPRGFERVIELDWWHSFHYHDLEFIFVPAQHWHRRKLNDYNRALWGGWMIRGSRTAYHCGDSGYFSGFRILGQLFAQIDVALLPTGAYEPEWFMQPQHMNPEQSVKAFSELGAKTFVPMHWGTFDLSDEPLNAGPRELRRIIESQNLHQQSFRTLAHGETLSF